MQSKPASVLAVRRRHEHCNLVLDVEIAYSRTIHLENNYPELELRATVSNKIALAILICWPSSEVRTTCVAFISVNIPR
jgi:hypothetical protein